LLLVPALPIMLLACLAIVLTTRQAPLLLQRRVGWRGAEFTMLKLRTMGCEDEPPACLVAKPLDDRRVTTAGRLLRRTSIDELPQLVNVIAGQMSLVGPRPGLPAEVAAYREPWRRRLSVRPGLTGLWQVSGRSSLPPERWMALDRCYLARRSLAFDLRVLARTVAAVISMRGAW
jgi:lipopolysaccharide/colanic/teichoic acid biosynthesis glycosyltransferase